MKHATQVSLLRICILLCLIGSLLPQRGAAQTTLTFTAASDGEHIPLDSILVVNVTAGGDTMLYAPDTVLVLDLSTGLQQQVGSDGALSMGAPYPNPFDGSARFVVGVGAPGQLALTIYDPTGRAVASYTRGVGAGSHAFIYEGGQQGLLFIVAELNGQRVVERMVSMTPQSAMAELSYVGSGALAQQGRPKELGPFFWTLGDSLNYTAYVAHAPVSLGLDSLGLGGIPVSSEFVPFNFITLVDILEQEDLAILDALDDTVLLPENILVRDTLTALDILQELDPDFPGMTGEGEVRDLLTPRQQLDLLIARMAYLGWFMISDDQHTYGSDGPDGPAQTGLAYGLGNKFYDVRATPTQGSCTHRIYGSDCSGMIYNMGTAASLHFPRTISNSNVNDAFHDTIFWKDALLQDYSGLKVKNKGQLPLDEIQSGDIIMWYGLSDGVNKWKHIGQMIVSAATGFKWIYQSNGDGSGCTANLSQTRGPSLKELTSAWLGAFGTTYDVFRFEMKGCQELTSVTDIDGNTYPVVTIGDQCWMAQNLATMTYDDGTAIPNVTDNTQWAGLQTGALAAYDNDPGNVADYGLLYNWYAAANPNICPQGWHVPTDAEWQLLEFSLGMESDELGLQSLRGIAQNVGGKMKATGLWNAPNTGATNESGFSGLPGGSRSNDGNYYNSLGNDGVWWSATENQPGLLLCRRLIYDNAGVHRGVLVFNHGACLRCIRD